MPTLQRMRLAAKFVICIAASFTLPCASAQSSAMAPLSCQAAQPRIHQEGFVRIGGIEQWVTVKGENCANPVILFVHGGPGNPNTVYAKLPYAAWEKEFTLVQWDQRGAGRTFSHNPATEDATLTVDMLVNDGLEVAAWAGKQLGAKKVILFGGSWGSLLGAHMAKAKPELFVAYVGTGQMVNYRENDSASYRKTLALARAGGDASTVATLEALGEPPWTNPRHSGVWRRAARKLEAKVAQPTPAQWWAPARQAEYERGEDYSWLQFVGLQGNGMLSTVDLPKLGLDYKIPVFMIQGEHDLTTVPEVAKRYFDSITAPEKAYYSLPNTGHAPNPEMLDAQYQVLTTRVLPLLRN